MCSVFKAEDGGVCLGVVVVVVVVDVFRANLNSDQRVHPLCGSKQELAWHCRAKEGFSHAK